MPSDVPIPDLDPISLPAPVWLLKALLLLTFFLHIIPMNFALGGGFITAATEFIGRKKNSVHHLSLASSLAKMLPITIAFTITLGVAPLLFVQVLYGQFFYSSSILIAWPWFSIVVILILAYYGFYLYAFRWEKLQGSRLILVLGSAVVFAIIGFLYTNNLVLMLTPEKWSAMYFRNPHGMQLNLSDPTVIPRYLHFFTASFALAGILVSIYGMVKSKENPDYGRWGIRYGVVWFLVATLIQLGIGSWFLLSLPVHIRNLFLGGDLLATGIFLTALLCALVSLVLMVVGYVSANPAPKVISGIGFITLTVVGMVLMRDLVRDAYLDRYFDVSRFPVHSQTGVIVLFFLLFVVGLVVLGYMVRKAVAARVTV